MLTFAKLSLLTVTNQCAHICHGHIKFFFYHASNFLLAHRPFHRENINPVSLLQVTFFGCPWFQKVKLNISLFFLSEFFSDREEDGPAVYSAEDMFLKADEEAGVTIRWLVTNAQKNALEPILVTLSPGASTEPDDPHEGEEFGYVLQGTITLISGEQKHRVRRGDAFYFHPTGVHYLVNSGKTEGRVLWVSTPPSF